VARIDGVDPKDADPRLEAVFEAQVKAWGAVLDPYLVYARRPDLFLAVRGMWDSFSRSGLLDDALQALVCRRVAALIGCPF
jgi:hypothetical protein